MNNETNSEIDQKFRALSCHFSEDIRAQTTLLWELSRNATEFAVPIVVNDEAFAQVKTVQSELRDVMLAEVTQIGHHDKYPKPYDWEDVLPTLRPNEELLWIVTKPTKERKFKLYLGIKFNCDELESPEVLLAREERFQILVNSFSKCLFPESEIRRKPNFIRKDDEQSESVKAVLSAMTYGSAHLTAETVSPPLKNIFCISGMPSPKDLEVDRLVAERKEDARPFLSLNDVLEPHLNSDSSFTVVFTISAAAASSIRDSFEEKFSLRSALKPLLERDIQLSENQSDGISITPEHETTTISRHTGFLRAIWGEFSRSAKWAVKWLRNENSYADLPTYDGEPSTTRIGAQKSESHSHSKGLSGTYHVSRADLKFVDEHLEKELKHLQQTLGAGGYYATAMVYAEKPSIGESVARSIRATLSGTHSYLAPMKVMRLDISNFFQLRYNRPIAELLRSIGFQPLILDRDSACMALLLPDADIPGCVKLKKSVFYARPAEENTEEVSKKNISFGKGAYYENGLTDDYFAMRNCVFTIPKKDIFSHAFIVGAPGSGKSQRAAYILNHIPSDIRLIVLETAKSEYRNVLHRPNRRLVRYTLGNSQKFPLRINPFYFDYGTNLKSHISVLADAIADLLPMEALIGPKLRVAVEKCYRRCGWDIETSLPISSRQGSPLVYPDMLMFNSEVAKVCEELSDYGPEVRANYTGALKNRAAIFLDDVYQDIFAFDGNKPLDVLFPKLVKGDDGKLPADVVIEMEDMPPSEINMPAFVISIILQRIRAYRSMKNESEDDRFVIAIEEAHNVLSRKVEQSGGDERQSGKGGHLLNQILRLLAEGRSLGMGLIVIDQAAHAIAPSVLADTNTKIVLRLEDGEEIKTVGTSIGLAEKDWPDLQRLSTGECIVKTKAAAVPVKLAPLRKSGEDDFNEELLGPVDISPRLRYAPYIVADAFLDDVFATGLFSRDKSELYAQAFIALVHDWNQDLARYIWGKYLFRQNKSELLDAHLGRVNSVASPANLEAYYANEFRRIMHDDASDAFMRHANLDNYFVANNNATISAPLIVPSAEYILKGARSVLSVMGEDLKGTSRWKDIVSLADEISREENLTKEYAGKIIERLGKIVSSDYDARQSLHELSEHLLMDWRPRDGIQDGIDLLSKYGIEEGDI